MDAERLVVRLLADATQYLGVLEGAQARLLGFSAGAVTAISKHTIQIAAEFQKSAVAFEVMTGSAQAGKDLLNEISRMAVETPFHSAELVDNAKQLSAYGFENKQIIPILQNLGDISAGTGTSLNRLGLAFGQVRTTGRLMGQELRQFTNAGVPLLDYLSRVMDVPIAKIPQMVRHGQVGFNDVAKAIQLMTQRGEKFGGLMERINKETVAGRWENFTETLAVAARNFGLAAFEAFDLYGAISSLTALTQTFGQRQEEIAGRLYGVRDALAPLTGLFQDLKRFFLDSAGGVRDFLAANRDLVVSLVVTAGGLLSVVLAAKAAGLAFGLLAPLVLSLLSPFGLVLAAGTALLAAFSEETGLGHLEAAVFGVRLAFRVLGEAVSYVRGLMTEAWDGGVRDFLAGLVREVTDLGPVLLRLTGLLAATVAGTYALFALWQAGTLVAAGLTVAVAGLEAAWAGLAAAGALLRSGFVALRTAAAGYMAVLLAIRLTTVMLTAAILTSFALQRAAWIAHLGLLGLAKVVWAALTSAQLLAVGVMAVQKAATVALTLVTTAWAAATGLAAAAVVGLEAALTASPFLVVAAAVAGLIVLLHQLGTFDGIGDIFGKNFGSMFGDLKAGFMTVVDLIKEGELQLAFKTALQTLDVAFKTLIASLRGAWDKFLHAVVSTGSDLVRKYMPMGDKVATLVTVYGTVAARRLGANAPSDDQNAAYLESARASAEVLKELVAQNRAVLGLSRDVRDLYKELNLFESVNTFKGPDGTVGTVWRNVKPPDFPLPAEALQFGNSAEAIKKSAEAARTALDYSKSQAESLRARALGDGISDFDKNALLSEAASFARVAADQQKEFGRAKAAADWAANAALAQKAQVDLVNKLQAFTAAGKTGGNQQDFKAGIDEAQARLRAAKDEMEAAAVRLSQTARDMGLVPQLPGEVITYINKLEKDLERTEEPLKHFTENIGMLEKAAVGAMPAAGAMVGGLGMFGLKDSATGRNFAIPQPLIDDELKRAGFALNFEQLRNKLGGGREVRQSPMLLAGSGAAQDVINASRLNAGRNVQEDILQVLIQAKLVQEQTRDHDKKVADGMETIIRNGGLQQVQGAAVGGQK